MTSQELTGEEFTRYSRQMLLPELGFEGQHKLRASRCCIIGAGGLGSPVALYLAAAGVGAIGIVDFDVVDRSNLHRQTLFSTADIGRLKVEAAKDRITAINPNVTVDAHAFKLDESNAEQVFADYDLILDGSDNFGTRYLVNDTAIRLGKPVIFGSIYRFGGQVSVFGLEGGPCYRCLFPEEPDPSEVPPCAVSGVLGVLPGVIGMLQATEAIKLITGIGESLKGRLLLYDALRMGFSEISLARNEDCPACGSLIYNDRDLFSTSGSKTAGPTYCDSQV